MATVLEVERRFLMSEAEAAAFIRNYIEAGGTVRKDTIRQSYLLDDPNKVIRVRTIQSARESFVESCDVTSTVTTIGMMTIKGRRTDEGAATEIEWTIPVEDAINLQALCDKQINKTRFEMHVNRNTMKYDKNGIFVTIDKFDAPLHGLYIAEVELFDAATITPVGLGVEITSDHRFANSNLANMNRKELLMLLNNFQQFISDEAASWLLREYHT